MSDDPAVAAWLDGAADEAACAGLAARVRSDPTLARQLIEGARDEVLLGLALGRKPDLAARVLAGLRGGDSRARLRRSVMRSVRTHPRRRASWLPLVLAAAAGLALVVVWTIADQPVAVSDQRPATSDQPPAPGERRPAAGIAIADLGRVVRAAGLDLERGGASRPALTGEPLQAGDRLHASAAGGGVAAVGADLAFAAGAVLRLAGPDQLGLDAGAMTAEVAPRAAGHALVISTPEGTATVVGTAFTLATVAGRTRLEVGHGLVRLAAGDATVAVAADGWGELRAGGRPELKEWRPLFAAFPAWQQQHGAWTMVDGVVDGEAGAGTARLLSPHDHADLDLRCRLRIRDVELAEIQVGDYNWFFEVPAADGWIDVRLRQRGDELHCTADGVELTPRPGAAQPSRPGPIGMYVRRGSLQVSAAEIRE